MSINDIFSNWFAPDASSKEEERKRQLQAQGLASKSDLKVLREIEEQEKSISDPYRVWKNEPDDMPVSEQDAREFKACMDTPLEIKVSSPGMPYYAEIRQLKAAIDTHAVITNWLQTQYD